MGDRKYAKQIIVDHISQQVVIFFIRWMICVGQTNED